MIKWLIIAGIVFCIGAGIYKANIDVETDSMTIRKEANTLDITIRK